MDAAILPTIPYPLSPIPCPVTLSVLDIFKIGLGPSSSHTMGPMNAACTFVEDLASSGALEHTAKVGAQLYGSLALTGRGHCTDRAVLLGLEGNRPDSIEPGAIEPALKRIRGTNRLQLAGRHEVEFDEPLDLLFHVDQTLPLHPNGLRFTAFSGSGERLLREEFYSTGGGFIVRAADFGRAVAGRFPSRCHIPSIRRANCCRPVATTVSSCTS